MTIDAERELCERYAEAWERRDVEGVLSCYSPDFTLHYFGDNRFSGNHVGIDAAVSTLLAIEAITPRRLVAVDEILTCDGGAVMVVLEELTIEGEPMVVGRALHFRIRNDQFTDCWLYEQNQALIDRAWGTEPASAA